MLGGGGERARGFLGIRWANDIDLRHNSNRSHCFDRFVGGPILADTDRVVGKDVNVWQLRERSETNRGPAIIREHQKRGTRSAENSVIRNAVHDRAHAVFANSEMNIATG